jgi:hypothetical protein
MTYVCPLCADDMTPCFITGDSGHLAQCHGMEKVLGTSVNRCALQPYVCAGCGYIVMFAKRPDIFRLEANRSRGTLPIPISERVLPPIDPSLPLSAKAEELPPGDSQEELGLSPPRQRGGS